MSEICSLKFAFVINFFLGSGSIFCIFASVTCILIGKDEEYGIFQTLSAMTFSVNTNGMIVFTRAVIFAQK